MRFVRKNAFFMGKILLILLILQLLFAGSALAFTHDAIFDMQKRLDALIAESTARDPWFETRTESTWWKISWDEDTGGNCSWRTSTSNGSSSWFSSTSHW